MKITRSNEVAWTDALVRGRYGTRRKALGGEKLLCSLYELPPGKKSFPFHGHSVTEEALFVISGHAKVRTPEGLTEIGPGDHVSFPANAGAHQLVNDGSETLVYLGMSANPLGVDIVDYPETGKVAFANFPQKRRMVFQADSQADYFAGDKDAEE